MKRLVVSALTAALAIMAPTAAMAAGLPGGPNPPQPLLTFPAGAFPESLAVRGGDLFVSLGFLGEVDRVTATGSATPYATGIPTGSGLLTGLAFGMAGNLYVGVATFSADPAPGVFVISPGGASATRVWTLPEGSFPNGLAFRDGALYVADSALGTIWRGAPGGTPQAWYQSALITPTTGIGANGIAFDASGKHLFVAVADAGRIVRLNLARGAVASADVVVEQSQLKSADGLSFDTAGRLYITVNDTNRLFRWSPTNGSVTRLADRSNGLSYPTQAAFASDGSSTLYLANGGLANGIAGIEVFDFGVGGLPLP
jgi:DNA-binding beta-propeller fold protein YncE